MSSPLVWIQGKISPPEDAKVSVFDRGFLFGDGVYEVGKAIDRRVLFLEEHWDRLRLSASKLSIEFPWSAAELTQGLFDTARAFGKDGLYFRTIVTRGVVDHIGLDVPSLSGPTLVHLVQDLPDLSRLHREGMRLLTSEIHRNSARAQDPNIKTSNYLNSLLALQDVKRRGGEDAVLCDPQGVVTEGTTFSIFAVTANSTLLTPSLSVGILDSITRRHVLQAAAALKMPVQEGQFQLAEFLECREVFLASSVRDILPVRSWDKREFSGIPGPVTQQLQKQFQVDMGQYLQSAPRF